MFNNPSSRRTLLSYALVAFSLCSGAAAALAATPTKPQEKQNKVNASSTAATDKTKTSSFKDTQTKSNKTINTYDQMSHSLDFLLYPSQKPTEEGC